MLSQKTTSGRTAISPRVFVTDLIKPIIQYDEARQKDRQFVSIGLSTLELVSIVEETDLLADLVAKWRVLYHDFLTNGVLPQDEIEARRSHRQAKSFVIIGGDLYKKGNNGIRQLCILIEQGK